MKKSKVIIPAMAMILFSTAASISGTVAWFTANRVFNTSAGEFAVVKTNADLDCDLAAGLGTHLSDGDDAIEVNDYTELTDASFNHLLESTKNYIYSPNAEGVKVGKKVALDSAIDYVPKTFANAGAIDGVEDGEIVYLEDKGDSTAGYVEITDKTTNPETFSDSTYTNETLVRDSYVDESSNTHTVLSAVTWDMTFKVSFGGAVRNYALFLDTSESKVTTDGTNAPTKTGKGFRMAFIPKGTNAAKGNVRVWADNQASGQARHLNGLVANDDLANPVTHARYNDGSGSDKIYSYSAGVWSELSPAATICANQSAQDAIATPTNGDYAYRSDEKKLYQYSTSWEVVDSDVRDAGTGKDARGIAYESPYLIDSTSLVALPDTVAVTTGNTCLGKFEFSANATVTLEFTVVAWYEGTDPEIINRAETGHYETVRADLKFGVCTLTA